MFDKIWAFFFSIILSVSALFGWTYEDKMPPYPLFPIIGIDEQAEDTVRVMSFNLRCTDVNGTPMVRRKTIVAEEIFETAPDSLGVQEATPEWMAYLRNNLRGYACVGEGRDGDGAGEFNAVFYNTEKWKAVDSATFWLSETPDRVSKDWNSDCRRVCTWVLLENLETGERYVHVNSHYDHKSSLARENGAKLVMELINEKSAEYPVVFTADMNSGPVSEPYKIMTEKLCDTRVTAEDIKSFGTFHNTKPETHAANIIDYILVTDDVTVKTYRTVTEGINGRFVSDHFPIYADIILPVKE